MDVTEAVVVGEGLPVIAEVGIGEEMGVGLLVAVFDSDGVALPVAEFVGVRVGDVVELCAPTWHAKRAAERAAPRIATR